jgi:hypothetical protein
VLVSGPSPFVGCPFGAADQNSVNYPNKVEPQVAVNPTNPDAIVGNFQQDRWKRRRREGARRRAIQRRRRLLDPKPGSIQGPST